jgi:putative SOS response-associated peptidase YedK
MLTASGEELARLFGLESVSSILVRYNISPSQVAPVAVHGGVSGRALREARWGLPRSPPRAASSSLLINARAETAAVKRSFRDALARKRCLVPASGFFEWRRGAKHVPPAPHLFTQPGGSPFAIAGLFYEPEAASPATNGAPASRGPRATTQLRLFEEAREPVEPRPSFVLLTTNAQGCVSAIHDRMPLILDPVHFASWLDPATESESILERLNSPPRVELVARLVSRRVNSAANDDEECIRAVPGRAVE